MRYTVIVMKDEIEKLLKTKFIGRKIYYYDSLASTNRTAREEADNGAPDGSLFIAHEQTAGRGRFGKLWSAPAGTAVSMSVLLRPSVEPENVAQITLIAGLAVCKAIREEYGVNAQIKWPNDIVIGTKKLCGILTEMSAQDGHIHCLICGIGVNVNIPEFNAELSPIATSLFTETGARQSRAAVAAAILNRFEEYYLCFAERGVTGEFLNEYKANCVTVGREIKAVYKNKVLFAKAVDIGADGSLIAEHDGQRLELSSGEVSVRGILGYV